VTATVYTDDSGDVTLCLLTIAVTLRYKTESGTSAPQHGLALGGLTKAINVILSSNQSSSIWPLRELENMADLEDRKPSHRLPVNPRRHKVAPEQRKRVATA
jgi:hypothetical protein